MTTAQRHHIGQRVKVGAIGLAIVVLLIMLAGAILGAVSRERPVAVGVNAAAVANLAVENEADVTEPLADMGVTPAANAAARN